MAVIEPPSPQEVLVHPDHAPITTSHLQTVDNTAKDLAGFKISIGDSRDDGSSTETSAHTSDHPSDVKIPIAQADNKNNCANCGHFDAKSYCAGCHEAPNTDGTPHLDLRYCTRECQKMHWPSHRTQCKNLQARKALFRAAWLLQKIWYTVRRESFDNDLISAEEVDGELLIREGNYDLESTKRKHGFYRDFPEAIFRNERDAEACLNLLYCTDSLGHMYMANHWLLKDICMDIKEIKVKVHKPARKCRYACDEWNQDFLHEILQVRLHSGEVYAIDFTGAQYGWYEPITEWSRYSLRCTEIVRVLAFVVDDKRPLGSRAQSMLMGTFTDPWDDRTDLQRAVPMFGECLKREFNKVFIQEVVRKHPRGLDILKLETRKLEAVEKEILLLTKQMTKDAAEKVDVLVPIITAEARACNDEMRKQIAPDTGAILKHGLIKLAALFNGEWTRDDRTGRLASVSLKRYMEDEDYAVKCSNGVLAEQKLWGNLTLNHGFRFL